MNTGRAVAGNMGSPQRLNYTVLGETVNMAARVCSAAVPGQVLATGATVAAAAEVGIPVRPVGGRALKGFAEEVELFAIGEHPEDAAAADIARPAPGRHDAGPAAGAGEAPGRPGAGAAGTVLPLLLVAWAVGTVGQAAPAAAQVAESGLPTLEELGLWWSSADGAYQLGFSGRADVEFYIPSEGPPGLIAESDPFAAGRVRVFADAFAGERVYGSVELRLDRGETPGAGGADVRVEQLFLRARVAAPLELQAGRFASPFGGYAQRHHTIEDPFVRPPLPYDWHTTLAPMAVPGDVRAFLTWRDRPGEFRARGAPVIWNVPYQWGVLALVGAGAFDARVGWMNSAPSSAPVQWGWDGAELGGWVAGAGVRVSPELRVGASWSRAPYLQPLTSGVLPTGARLQDYEQELIGVEAVLARGPLVLRGEAFHDRWNVPNVEDDVVDASWYLEAQSDLTSGLWVAGRVGATHFQEVGGGANAPTHWDHDVRRLQLSSGYRFARNLEAKVEWMGTDMEGPLDPRDDLVSMQLWWAY
jgi:hypothetical protein